MIEQVNAIARMWCNWMWPMFWQVSVLIGFIALLDFLIRRHVWPQVRYALWLLVLVKLLMPPSFSLRTSVVSHVRPMVERSVRQPSATDGPAFYPLLDRNMSPDEPSMTTFPHARASLEPAAGAEVIESPAQVDAGISAASVVRASLSWRAIAMLGWMVTMLLLMLRLLLKHRVLWCVHCTPMCSHALPAWMPKLLEDTARKLRLRRSPQVVLSSTVNCPAVLGVFKPVLLLPEATIERLSRQQAEHILLHELAHIKRRDLPVHALCVLLQIFYWFNPLLALVRRQLQHLRELCCDATVATILKDKTEDYSQTILRTVEWLLEKPRWCGIGLLGLIEDPSRLRVRLVWLRKKPSKHPGLRTVTAMILVVAMFVFILPMAKAQKSAEGSTVVTSVVDETPTKSLREAANDGDIEQVKLHLATGTDINAKDQAGWTALHHAASKGHMEVAKLLISKGADVNERTSDWTSALHSAVRAGFRDIVEFLIEKGADVNAKNDNDRVPLHEAVLTGQEEMVKLLIAKGADVDSGRRSPMVIAMDSDRKDSVELLASKSTDISPLHLAIYMKDEVKAKSLIEAGADVNKKLSDQTAPLHMAIRADLLDVVRLLIQKGADVNATRADWNWTPLHEAAYGHKDIVELLIASGANVNVCSGSGGTPLGKAETLGHKDIVELLLANGADANSRICKWTHLHTAAANGNKQMAESLISEGANVNARNKSGQTPLHLATLGGHKEVVALLLAKGANVNAGAKFNRTALHIAARKGYKEVVELLLEKGADIHSSEYDNSTAADRAMVNGHTEILELLISKGADISPLHMAIYLNDEAKAKSLIESGVDVNKQTPNGNTPLKRAIEKGLKDIAKLLIAHGADVNADYHWGYTPLHAAAADGQKDMVELLIAKGANINAEHDGGRTPLSKAKRGGHTDIVELLKKHGAIE